MVSTKTWCPKLNMNEHEKCGWCKKALTKKRRKESPVGADCEQRLPDKLKVAILNITLHDGAHCPQESKWNIAKRSIDDYFGEDAEIVIIVDQNYGAGFAEADIVAFYNDEGTPVLINQICPDQGESALEDEEPLFCERGLELKRNVAMMIDPRTPTEIEVIHIDADWLWFMNGGYYYGPISSEMSVEDACLEKGWPFPQGACEFCYLLLPEQEGISEAEDSLESWKNHEEHWNESVLSTEVWGRMCHGVRKTLEYRQTEYEKVTKDFRLHPWYREIATGFIGELEQWAIPEAARLDGPTGFNVWESDTQEYFDEVGGYTIEKESELGKEILAKNVVPFLLRNLTAGFDDNWKWVVGKAKFDDVEDKRWDYIASNNEY